MDFLERQYYQEMAKRDRLVTFYDNDRLAYILTFYIGNESDKDKFIRKDMWMIVNDNSDGEVCFVDHLINSKNDNDKKLFFKFKKVFMNTIRTNFPSVLYLRWNRLKNDKQHIYYEKTKPEVVNGLCN